MFPLLFEIPVFGGIRIYTYGVLVAAGFLIGIFWTTHEAKIAGVPTALALASITFEKETLSKVIEARARAVGATTVAGKGEAENMLTQALSKLFALVENYPDLKSNQNILQFQEELTSTENRVGFARQFYNDIVAQFNIKQGVFPSNIIAAIFGFKEGEYFQAE